MRRIKRMSKKQAQWVHFRRRCAERLGFRVSRGKHDELVWQIRDGSARFVHRQSHRVSLFAVEIEGRMARVVYDSKRKGTCHCDWMGRKRGRMSIYRSDWKPSELEIGQRYWFWHPLWGEPKIGKAYRPEVSYGVVWISFAEEMTSINGPNEYERHSKQPIQLGPRIDPPREIQEPFEYRCSNCGEPCDDTGCFREPSCNEHMPRRLDPPRDRTREALEWLASDEAEKVITDDSDTIEVRIPVAQRGRDTAWLGYPHECRENLETKFRILFDDPPDRIVTVVARIPAMKPQPDIEVEGEARDG